MIVDQVCKAAPYEINGNYRQGKVHAVKEGQRFYCGQELQYTGGEIRPGQRSDVTCKSCARSADSAEKWERQREEWKKQEEQRRGEWEQRQAERVRENEDWWAWYKVYLESPEWRARRRLVLERAGMLCEGCRQARPAHIHHLSYKHAGDELLYELVALCTPCHQKEHPDKDILFY